MFKEYIHRLQDRALSKIEDSYSGKLNYNGNVIALLKLDKIGDYILFRNFIEETYKHFNGTRKIVFCGNIAVKEFAETLDGEFVSEFIWVDVPKLDKYSYRISIYKQLRKAGCNTLINCAYSRTAESDKVALYSGASEIIGHFGDESNIMGAIKKENDTKYTKLFPGNPRCMFEFYRNRELFNFFLGKQLSINAPFIKASLSPQDKKNTHIVIFPGAGEEKRRWDLLNYRQLAKEIHNIFNLPVLICGPENEKAMGEQIVSQQEDVVINAIGKYDLNGTMDVIKSARFVVSGDTGAMHLALALGAEAICISNGNYYERFCPYPEAMHMLLTVVYPDEFEKRIRDKNNLDSIRCAGSDMDINTISPEKVISAIKNLIAV